MGDSASSFWSQRKSYFFRQSSFPYEFFSFVFCNGTFLKIIWINLLNVLLLWLDSGFCETMVQICLRCSVPNRMTGTFSVVVAKSCVTLFHPLSCSAPGVPVLHHISNVCSWSWWCHSTILSSVALSLPTFPLSQHQGLFQWVSSLRQVAKVLALQLQYYSFQWIFRVDFL